MTRRGWLLKVKNDEKILTGRVKTGNKIENDGLDIIQPVGLCAHVKPSEKTEVLTMDVGADTSRRVIMSIFGNREHHPKPDENEIFLYAPGEKEGKQFLRMKRKKEDKKDGDGQQSRADGEDKDSSGNKDSGRPAGMHWDQLKEKVSGTTENTFQNNADSGQGFSTKEGSVDIKAGKNTQFEAKKHLRKGEHHVDGTSYVNGNVHANDCFAGGGTTIQSAMGRARADTGGSSEDKPDGSKEWQANGRQGQTSLLQTAARVGTLQSMLNSFMQSQGQQNDQQQQQNNQQNQTNQEQQQTNEQTNDQLQQLLARIAALEAQVQQLQGG